MIQFYYPHSMRFNLRYFTAAGKRGLTSNGIYDFGLQKGVCVRNLCTIMRCQYQREFSSALLTQPFEIFYFDYFWQTQVTESKIE